MIESRLSEQKFSQFLISLFGMYWGKTMDRPINCRSGLMIDLHFSLSTN